MIQKWNKPFKLCGKSYINTNIWKITDLTTKEKSLA